MDNERYKINVSHPVNGARWEEQIAGSRTEARILLSEALSFVEGERQSDPESRKGMSAETLLEAAEACDKGVYRRGYGKVEVELVAAQPMMQDKIEVEVVPNSAWGLR